MSSDGCEEPSGRTELSALPDRFAAPLHRTRTARRAETATRRRVTASASLLGNPQSHALEGSAPSRASRGASDATRDRRDLSARHATEAGGTEPAPSSRSSNACKVHAWPHANQQEGSLARDRAWGSASVLRSRVRRGRAGSSASPLTTRASGRGRAAVRSSSYDRGLHLELLNLRLPARPARSASLHPAVSTHGAGLELRQAEQTSS